MKIAFGTDGWRGIIGFDFTVENVLRATHGILKYLEKRGAKNNPPKVVIGYDIRFGGNMYASAIAWYLATHGVNVILGESFCTTPALSLATKHFNCDLGIMMTASHNPPEYNGYKVKAWYGGPLPAPAYKEVEKEIPESIKLPDPYHLQRVALEKRGVVFIDLCEVYIQHLRKRFKTGELYQVAMSFVYDAMYGTGHKVWRRIFSGTPAIRMEESPVFMGIHPEPIEKNLEELKKILKGGSYLGGAATDGDADRMALCDENGNYIDPHKTFLLLLHSYCKYSGADISRGKVVMAVSTSTRVAEYCEKMGIPVEVVPVGFKNISEKFIREDVIMGGEESGGYALREHLPERDGIYNILFLLETIHKTGKSISLLLKEALEVVGDFHYKRIDVKCDEETRNKVHERVSTLEISHPSGMPPREIIRIDGVKFLFRESSLLVRVSGTEPLIRLYAEGPSPDECIALLKKGVSELGLEKFVTF